jgi:hypothetical protein
VRGSHGQQRVTEAAHVRGGAKRIRHEKDLYPKLRGEPYYFCRAILRLLLACPAIISAMRAAPLGVTRVGSVCRYRPPHDSDGSFARRA